MLTHGKGGVTGGGSASEGSSSSSSSVEDAVFAQRDSSEGVSGNRLLEDSPSKQSFVYLGLMRIYKMR